MNRVNLVAVAMAGLIAGSAFAATSVAPAKNKIIVKKKAVPAKKLVAKKAPAVKASALSKPSSLSVAPKSSDSLKTSASSATSAATLSVPGSSAGTTTKTLGQVAKRPSVADNFRFAVSLEYYGGALSDPFSGYQPDVNTETSQSDATNRLDTHLIIGYKLSPNMTLSLNPYFTSSATSVYKKQKGKGGGQMFMKPTASHIRLQFGKFVSKGPFTWNGDIRYYPQVTDDLINSGTTHYLRTGQNFMYAINSKFTLAAYNTIRYYVRDADKLDEAQKESPGDALPAELRVTMSPSLEYQASDNLGFGLSYNMDVNKPYRQSLGNWVNAGGVDAQYLEFGMTWGITKRIEFNPYIDMYTKHMDPNAMQLGANLSFSIL